MYSDQDKIDCINQSPAAVAAHDKAAWLGLFASNGLVNDPVGSKPHVGQARISRFYDTFIAPNRINFDVAQDTVCGMTVVRDLIIETTMSTGLRVDVPTHIRYELVEQDGALKIQNLYAHWELMPMVLQTLRQGISGLVTYGKLSVHMIRCQGIGGVLGFMKGFGGVGKAGKLRAEELLTAISQGDAILARGLMGYCQSQELPAGNPVSPDALVEQLQGLRWTKLTAAGSQVTATVFHGEQRGVVLLTLDRKRHIESIAFYL